MIIKIYSELGASYESIATYLEKHKVINLTKYKLKSEEKIHISILIEKSYLKIVNNKNNRSINLIVNINGILKRLLIPQYLLLIEKYWPKDLIYFQKVLFNEVVDSNIFYFNKDLFIDDELNNNKMKINYSFLNINLYKEIILKYLNEKINLKVANLFKLIINNSDSNNSLNEFDDITIFKLISQPFINYNNRNNININYLILESHIIINFITKLFDKTTTRIIRFAFENIEFYDEDLIFNTLIPKEIIKLHTIRLFKKGYLQLINPEGSKVQKWKFDFIKAVDCFKRDSICFINEMFGIINISKDLKAIKKYFNCLIGLFFINFIKK
ncbi:hypothetical protein CDIK_3051 [Cucumispora dikerogammari]|nr:hypothetical protein CDIK_3051 [Cucumispora dikerogammari]